MKFIFMLLALFLLTDPVLANPVNNTSECLSMYGHYMEEYGDSQLIPEAQVRDFIGRCLPDDSASRPESLTYIDGTRHQKLFHAPQENGTPRIKM